MSVNEEVYKNSPLRLTYNRANRRVEWAHRDRGAWGFPAVPTDTNESEIKRQFDLLLGGA